MARVLYAWELGNNLGHVGAFLPLARILRQRGDAVHWAVAQPALAAELLAREGFQALTAPSVAEIPRQGMPVSYAEILLRFGYADPAALSRLVDAWRQLIRSTGAQLLVADHAPTAMLAARTLDIPVMLFCYGFTAPPLVSPMPNLRPWIQVPDTVLHQADQLALFSVNSVLERHRSPQLRYLCELFDVAESSMMTFPELDHYRPLRQNATYWGAMVSSMSGEAPEWPAGAGPRIFAYLRREVRHAEAILEALGRNGFPALVVFPDAPAELVQRHRYPNLTLLTRPIASTYFLARSELAVTYGGHGLTAAFLRSGIPVLLLPGQLEQFVLAQRVLELGAGFAVSPDSNVRDIGPAFAMLVDDRRFRDAALAFASKYASFDPDKIADNLVRRIDVLTAPPAEVTP
jgi:UDP:flavonoid glycosyltransferase YjiC (YdhE family)